MNPEEQKNLLKDDLRLRISSFKDLIEEYNGWNGKISQESIARLIGVQPSYLSRQIKPKDDVDSIASLENTNKKLQILIEQFSEKDNSKTQISKTNNKKLRGQIGKQKRISTFKALFFISIALFLANIIYFQNRIASYQREIANIKDWYTSPDSVLAETYLFLKEKSNFNKRLDILKGRSLDRTDSTEGNNYIINNRDKTYCDNHPNQCFLLFGKTYARSQFFIMQNGKLIEDASINNSALGFIEGFRNEGMLNSLSDDRIYLNNVLGIEGGNQKISANLTYLAIQDTLKDTIPIQTMVRFPAYMEFDSIKMSEYQFEDRPWSPFKYEKDTTYLTQPYGDIRNGLMPVRTYVRYYHKMHKGRKIKMAIGVDLIYSIE